MADQERPAGDNGAPGSAGPTRNLVVGLGASAGGLYALKSFFRTVPADSGISFVVVVHLSAEHESHLANLLQPHAALPVVQVTADTRLEPDRVYVIPPGRNLSAVDSHLRVATFAESDSRRNPVDFFFRTLAETYDGSSVGVILSGTGSDGAQGIAFIRERGGMTIVQDPEEAEFDGMPRTAILTGLVDCVLPIERMMEQILEFASARPDVPVPDDRDGPPPAGADPLQAILTLVRLRTGHDFMRYKRSTVARRVARRMQVLNVEQLEEYTEILREDAREAAALLDDLLINVTGFFRDPEVFRTLESSVIPSLFENKGRGDAVRVWSVGCATGEEAYSVGILLLEEAARRQDMPQVQVFATDLHERSLQKGREALYADNIAAEMTAERLERFFTPESGGFRVAKRLRDVVVFATHNVLRDPPFSRLDLIICRNVLIYLQRDVQDEVVDVFHYALRPGGYLLLGTAETLDRSDQFLVENKEAHLYRRRETPRSGGRLPSIPASPVTLQHSPALRTALAPPPPQGYGTLHQRMLERYAPPSLLIAPDHDIVHTSESVGRYLQYPAGEASRNLFKVVRDEFRMELRTALHMVRERKAVWRSRPLVIRFNGDQRTVVLRVSPVEEPDLEGFTLIIFDEMEDAAASVPPPAADDSVRELESELELTRSRMQAIIEEFETSQEEMRASNEELQSANEELRSTMEELETSREELQSVNEELQTLNQENRHKVEELSQISSDLQNLLQATDVATIFLDRNLRILRYTPRVSEIFNVRHSDRGRPLADLTHRLGYAGLIEDARRVLQRLVPVEREVAGQAPDTWYSLRVAPYRTMDDRIEGVVITLVDISKVKAAEAALRELNESLERRVEERTQQVREQEARLRTLIETAALTVWTAAPDGTVTDDSPSWRNFTGQSVDDLLGEGWLAAVHPEDRDQAREHWFRSVAARTPVDLEFRVWHARSENWQWTNLRAAPLHTGGEVVTGWIGMNIDIDGRKRAEQARREALRQLVTAEEEERRRISRELHDSLGQLVTGLILGLRALEHGSTDTDRLRDLQQLADRIARGMQNMAVELRPPALDNLGLAAALQNHLDEWSTRHGVRTDFHATGLGHARLSPVVEVTVFRVVQEALTNVLKHAGANHVNVVLERRGGTVRVIVEDDGRGFDVDASAAAPGVSERLGLRGMRERVALLGGDLDIESSPGSGTTLFVRLPLGPT